MWWWTYVSWYCISLSLWCVVPLIFIKTVYTFNVRTYQNITTLPTFCNAVEHHSAALWSFGRSEEVSIPIHDRANNYKMKFFRFLGCVEGIQNNLPYILPLKRKTCVYIFNYTYVHIQKMGYKEAYYCIMYVGGYL